MLECVKVDMGRVKGFVVCGNGASQRQSSAWMGGASQIGINMNSNEVYRGMLPCVWEVHLNVNVICGKRRGVWTPS